MNFEFQYIYFIWLSAGVLLFLFLFSLVKRWKKRTIRKIGEPALVKSMIRGYSPFRFNLKFFLLCLAFLMGVLCTMSLRKPGGNDGIQRKGIDVVFALDLSKSMLAQDVKPSRLLFAKQFISKMMDAMPNNRVGLVWFAGKAYIQMPISADHSSAQMYVNDASPDVVPVKGTVIGDALEESLRSFGEREAKYKAVILISDGEDHDEKALELSKDLQKRGLMVNTVGIGSPEGTFIPDDSTGGNKLDPQTGRPIVSKLNQKELEQIAVNTNGVYVHLTDIDAAVKKITQQLAQIDKKVTGDTNLMSFSYYFWIFAAAMVLLLVIEQLLPEGKKAKT
ncbi:VWA domain-containing protein [Niabella drilacis]|uniref:Ca-activated chloride channel family protein n=1 Tax=Niabella drilacis (strain DSM 25811 / CCM 8410 / CCUG 62505 / LMG 26954 / E90) TaxID=1285928 RepID=A0A1G6NQE9_NIADE|nr:VWA domain-containing protein [Niabella drilacis]SDC69536.1 Ca-activated chloride channel family protein [Niabella drilacis]